MAGAILLGAASSASSAVVYTQTIVNPLAVVSTLDDFSNCRDSEGCLGKTGQVFDAAGNALAAGNIGPIQYSFTLTPADITAINAAGAGATLTMVAARDLGLRAGTPTNTDFLVTTLEGTGIGNLFGDTVSTCPAGENFNPINFTCGPNYHNDVTAVSSLDITSSLLLSAIADGVVDVLVTPTADVGRLKVFSITLEAGTVPEPSSLLLLAIGMAALAGGRLARKPQRVA
jgi:hypothetical protein